MHVVARSMERVVTSVVAVRFLANGVSEARDCVLGWEDVRHCAFANFALKLWSAMTEAQLLGASDTHWTEIHTQPPYGLIRMHVAPPLRPPCVCAKKEGGGKGTQSISDCCFG